MKNESLLRTQIRYRIARHVKLQNSPTLFSQHGPVNKRGLMLYAIDDNTLYINVLLAVVERHHLYYRQSYRAYLTRYLLT